MILFAVSARRLMAAWGAELGLVLRLDSEWACAVAFNRDGRLLLSGSGSPLDPQNLGRACIWDTATGNLLHQSTSHDGPVGIVAFSHDGQSYLTGSNWLGPGRAHVWNTATGEQICETLPMFGRLSVAISPDDRTLVTGGWDKAARLWDAKTCHPRGELMQHTDMVTSVAFSPDGKRALTGSADKTGRLWDAATGKPLSDPILLDDEASIVAFSPDGELFFVGTREYVHLRHRHDTVSRLYDATTAKPHGDRLETDGEVSTAAFSPDSRRLVAAAGDTAWVFDVATGKRVARPLAHEKEITAVAFSPDSQMVATASNDKTAQLWDAATGRPIGSPVQHEDEVDSVAFSPDGRMLATASGVASGRIRIWDLTSARLRPTAQQLPDDERPRHRKTLTAFSADGRLRAAEGPERFVQAWDETTQQPIGDAAPCPGYVSCLAISFASQTMLTGGGDGKTRLWDLKPGGAPQPRELLHCGEVHTADFSPDGRILITGSLRTAQLWDVGSGQPLGSAVPLDALLGTVRCSADGKTAYAYKSPTEGQEWDVAPPLPDEPDPLRIWTQARTGFRTSEFGLLEPLSAGRWKTQHEALAKLGTPWNQWRTSVPRAE